MKCVICKQSDWQNVDEYRIKPHSMSMCKSCGFVSYPERYKSKEQVLEYYRKDYRGTPPKVGNLYTGQRKLHYHEQFLQPVIKQWIKEGKKNPTISDVGAAYGLFLAWWKNIRDEKSQVAFPEVELLGVELTLSFRRVAYHEFGLNLTETFDETKQYDLITSYKVAEHMFDIDQELVRYRKALKPGGKLYVSVPIWFDRMTNFGAGGFDIEYYYHPDHVNVWNRKHFEKLLAESGFKIIKEDHLLYDSTYLCEPCEPAECNVDIGPKETLDNLDRVFKANEECQKKEFTKALELFPKFPVAWRAAYEFARAEHHKKGWAWIKENFCEKWLSIDPNYPEAISFAADLGMRYNDFDYALKLLHLGLQIRNNDAGFLTQLANCYRTMADQSKHDKEKFQEMIANARQCSKVVKTVSLSEFGNATTWIYNDHAQLPMPGE